MVQINEVVPNKFRVGDLIEVNGFGFSPDFGKNSLAIGGVAIALLEAESATKLTAFVPVGILVDQYVSVAVFRSDTLDNDFIQAFSAPTVDSIRDGTYDPPGQIPGPVEASDPVRVEDTPQAQDYERMVAAIQHLIREKLTVVGDLFASDGAGIVAHPLGAAGQRLGANPATATGMEYAATATAQTLQWAGRKLAASVVLGGLTANGESRDTATIFGPNLSPLTGTARELIVLFAEGVAGDTLDQVVFEINGVPLYDSGTGLGIAPGGFHAATLGLAVNVADSVEIQCKKLGANGDGDFVGHVEFR